MASKAPLQGIRVVELAGLAPGPFTTLLLADFGASVLRIDRPHPLAHTPGQPPPTADLLVRRKASIAVDLKSPGGVALLRELLRHVDVFVDPYRPGVLETLGLVPSELLALNKRLIIARLTGFRRDGKYSTMAGHDINYLAVSGVLSQLGRKNGPPHAPGNILADFAGGGLTCALGVMIALFIRGQTGEGQVVESNMVDGSAYLATMMRLGTKTPLWNGPRGENLLDGGCPWYDTYETKDGGHMAVGALEPQFFAEFIRGLGLDSSILALRNDRQQWPSLRETFRQRFLQKPRREWETIFDGKDACCTPILSQLELESSGYDQRAAVGLLKTPSLFIDGNQAWASPGLSPGSGGEEELGKWTGWHRGREFEVQNGGLVKKGIAKI